jgi:hypothetical protein
MKNIAWTLAKIAIVLFVLLFWYFIGYMIYRMAH